MNSDDLELALLKAHADENMPALVQLYTEVGNQCEAAGKTDAACFYLTHAYVFALDVGTDEATELNERLVDYGRASPLDV